jgi:hypothetical protein
LASLLASVVALDTHHRARRPIGRAAAFIRWKGGALMPVEMSVTQRKRLEKIERLKEYFGHDWPEIYVWHPAVDEALDFKAMSDKEVAKYLKPFSS